MGGSGLGNIPEDSKADAGGDSTDSDDSLPELELGGPTHRALTEHETDAADIGDQPLEISIAQRLRESFERIG
jgi:hypothetical protein